VLHLYLSKAALDKKHHDMVGPRLLLGAPAGILPAATVVIGTWLRKGGGKAKSELTLKLNWGGGM
jgi:hypothetical protein